MPNSSGNAWTPVTVKVGDGLLGPARQASVEFVAQALKGTFAWGAAPGTATITYAVIAGAPSPADGVVTGADVRIFFGNHYFAGLCTRDVLEATAEGGEIRTLEFADYRAALEWNFIFAVFNKQDVRLINGTRVKRYKHMLPADWDAGTWTYTNTAYTAGQIVEFILSFRAHGVKGGVERGTVGLPWEWDFTGGGEFPGGVLGFPIYDVDFFGGRSLSSALAEVAQRTATVFTLNSSPQHPFVLAWVRKEFGTLGFPPLSDGQRLGTALSGAPTNVRIVGDRNKYQVMDQPMIPDWAAAWEDFLVFEDFADDLYNFEADPQTGIPFRATPNDPEQYIGRQLANARAMEITVREYVATRNNEVSGEGDQYADFRKFAGRSRMDMPAALYIQMLLFRAFRPSATALLNVNELEVPITSLDIADQLLCRVSHDPLSGVMSFFPLEPVDGNGYAIVKGYRVGADLFRTLKPEQFNVNFFSDAARSWASASFQIDDSGEGVRFIIFDEPVFVSDNLLVQVNGQCVLNSTAVIVAPPVRAALVLEAESFSYWQGTYPNVNRDYVENVAGLNLELVLQNQAFTEVRYADGQTAAQKAVQIANFLLLREFAVTEGGYKLAWDGLSDISEFGVNLSSLVDRIEINISPDRGVTETVDFCAERQRDYFEPERELERKTVQNSLLPGQQALRHAAEDARKLAAGLRQSPKFVQLLGQLINGTLGSGEPLSLTWINGPSAGTLAAGTPMRKTPTTVATSPPTNTLATDPTGLGAGDVIFMGVTVREGEDKTKPFYVQSAGEALARVKGPVAANDPIGLGATTDTDYLIKNGTPPVGLALQAIGTSAVALIRVRLGMGAAGQSGGINWQGFYDPTKTYKQYDLVYVNSGSPTGLWLNVASSGSTGVAPSFPQPSTTGGTDTWQLFAFGTQSVEVCTGGGKTLICNGLPPS
jgi:hypothetical protein